MAPARIPQETASALRELCLRSAGARRFFGWAAGRQKDARETSIDVLEERAGMDRAHCIELAKDMERLKCGRYVVGRRGSKTRVAWEYQLLELAQAAVGAASENADQQPAEDNHRVPAPRDVYPPQSEMHLTIAEAKRRLAASLGVSADRIEITIRG